MTSDKPDSLCVEAARGSIFAGDFRIERELGRGGMGVVYVARQLSTGYERALKLMNPLLVRDEDMRRRFEQEAQVGSRIRSEHIVQVVAAGVDATAGMPWIAMELLEGEDLDRFVTRNGPVGLPEACRIFAEICHALSAAHEVGIVHRDLKPENVFLSRSRREGQLVTAKLLDLGIAKIVADAQPMRTAAVGTPMWMAPEQTGGAVTPAADVWSLGLLMFWMLTGRSYWTVANGPPNEQSVMSVLKEIVISELESASARARRFGAESRLFPGFDAWFARCVAREPGQRFQSASEARRAFQRIALEMAVTAPLLSLPRLQSDPLLCAQSPHESITLQATAASTRLQFAKRRAPAGVFAIGLIVAVIAAVFGAWPHQNASQATNVTKTASSKAREPIDAPMPAKSAPSVPAPPTLSPGQKAVDQSDSRTIWKIPIGDSPERGLSDAPVTIVEFGNFQCPLSKAVERGLKEVLEKHPNEVRLVWKDDPLAIHSQAEAAATLAREARAKLGESGFWAAHDILLDKNLKPTPDKLLEVAAKLGLEPVSIAQAISARHHAESIERDADLADDFAALGTPYFFVNGRRIPHSMTLDKLRAAVEEELIATKQLEASGVPRSEIYSHLTANGRGALPLETRKIDFYSPLLPNRGPEATSAVLIEFCDYTHFMCRLVDPTIDDLLQSFRGKLTATWWDLPSDGELPRLAAIAGRVAWQEKGSDGFTRLRRLMLDGQRKGLSRNALVSFGEIIGFDRNTFAKSLESQELMGQIDREAAEARKQQIELPGFLVCGPDFCLSGGYYLSGGHPRRAFEKRIRLIIENGGVAANGSPR